MRKITPANIIKLDSNEIFVFGSNLAGRHGRGTAFTAHKYFGAGYHIGYGRTGQCFAIPTKNANFRILALSTISTFVKGFLTYAQDHSELEFLVTPIGCGLSRYEPKDIAPMFREAPPNVWLPLSFIKILGEKYE